MPNSPGIKKSGEFGIPFMIEDLRRSFVPRSASVATFAGSVVVEAASGRF